MAASKYVVYMAFGLWFLRNNISDHPVLAGMIMISV